jgi:hypothetical protein
MLDHSGSPAHWLEEIYQGKKLREPINVVIVDTQATSVDDAKERFVEASARAGYTIRMGHSSGYRALIAGEPHDQLPTGWDDAFSNHLFEVTNNHGRMFGPIQHGRSYILIGAHWRVQSRSGLLASLARAPVRFVPERPGRVCGQPGSPNGVQAHRPSQHAQRHHR